MQKRAPTLANIVVITLFILSCFGLLLFLWETFGGSVPLKPKGYQFSVDFPRTLLLAEESDVRISGVSVGHIVSLTRADNGRNHVTIEVDHQYAPIRRDAHVILRQKTLLGETYVEILPGPKLGPNLPEGGELAKTHVEPIVTFDDILSALDPQTRRDFQVWQQSLAEDFAGHGEDINATFAEFEPLVIDANKAASIAAEQEGALTAIVHNTGVVFDALGERDHQFEGMIVNGERAFSALARSSQAFAQVWRELPALERNGRSALRELDAVSVAFNPVFDQLRPAEIELAALLKTVKTFSPDLNNLLTGLGPLTSAAKVGLPDVKKQLDLTVPLLERAIPFTRNFNPFLEELSRYVPELQALFANVTAASEGTGQEGGAGGPRLHNVRALNTINPDSLALYAQRTGFNRSNAYAQSGAANAIASGGMSVFEASSCSRGVPTLGGPGNAQVPLSLIELLVQLHYINPSKQLLEEVGKGSENPEQAGLEKLGFKGQPGPLPEPACKQAPPFSINGRTTQYPQIGAAGK
jgi:phospholipid/cholesterol/gamma-HCH transport system substrate-binding protein